MPLHELLGRPAKRIPSGLSIGLKDTKDELLRAVERAVAKGYHRVKMKVKKGQDVDWVQAVRDRFPSVPLMVDANGDYTLADIEHLEQLDAFDLRQGYPVAGYDPDPLRGSELQNRAEGLPVSMSSPTIEEFTKLLCCPRSHPDALQGGPHSKDSP